MLRDGRSFSAGQFTQAEVDWIKADRLFDETGRWNLPDRAKTGTRKR